MEAVVDIGGMAHSLESDDDYLAAMGPVFEPDTVRLFNALVGGVALDVGANIGITALLLGQLSSHVHAFEPAPSTFAFLQRNTRSASNVTTHNLGLADKSMRTELTYSENNRSGGYISDQTRASAGHVTEAVSLLPMDKAVKRLRIPAVDFIKIDVEGFEGGVIKGAKRTLRRNRPVVTMELNHWCLNALRRTSLPDFLDHMRSVFPILYAVEADTYLDLHDPAESYVVMYRHIQMGHYPSLVGAFDADRLARFVGGYRRGA